jgi:hypothetical protein
MQAKDILVRGVVIKYGGIIVMESVFIMRDSEIISEEKGFYCSSLLDLKCTDGVPLETVHIIDSSTTITVITSPCTRVNLQSVLISGFVHYDFALSVYSTLLVVLTDIIFQNNSSPLMNLDTTVVDFTRNFISFSSNNDGVHVLNGHVIIHPGSYINISGNHFGKVGLNFLNCQSVNIGNGEDAVVMYFYNNTINKNRLFSIINTNGRIVNVMISFINNTSIGFEEKLGHE